jgi:hypothetical protein
VGTNLASMTRMELIKMLQDLTGAKLRDLRYVPKEELVDRIDRLQRKGT